jgi:hypothetical protein
VISGPVEKRTDAPQQETSTQGQPRNGSSRRWICRLTFPCLGAHASRLATKPHTIRNDTTAASRCNSRQPSEEGYTGPRFWAFHLFSDSGHTARLCDWYGTDTLICGGSTLSFGSQAPKTFNLACMLLSHDYYLATHLTWVNCVRYSKHFWSFV